MVVQRKNPTRRDDLTSIFHHLGICRDERETEQVFQHMCQVEITEIQAVERKHCLSQTAASCFKVLLFLHRNNSSSQSQYIKKILNSWNNEKRWGIHSLYMILESCGKNYKHYYSGSAIIMLMKREKAAGTQKSWDNVDNKGWDVSSYFHWRFSNLPKYHFGWQPVFLSLSEQNCAKHRYSTRMSRDDHATTISSWHLVEI